VSYKFDWRDAIFLAILILGVGSSIYHMRTGETWKLVVDGLVMAYALRCWAPRFRR
jgi:hypothetical protein